MNAHINALRTTSLQIILAAGLLIAVGMTNAAEPVLTKLNSVTELKNTANNVVEVLPAAYERTFNSEGEIPLAREDVVPPQTAVSGLPGTLSTPADETQLKISSRATNSQMQSFLARTNMQQLLTVYREASQLIDTRHVTPPSYEIRGQNAVQDVINALSNTDFLRVNNANVNPQMMQSVQMQLQQTAQAQPARDVNQALALMQTTAEIVNRATGIRREAIALEFLNGTVESLDKYSAFMPENGNGKSGAVQIELRTAAMEENIVGIGVELKTHAQGVEIVGIVDNSPASELGLREGDLIVGIAQQNMAGKTLNDVADRLAGPAGSSVTLDILRNGQKFRGTLVRRKVHVSSVSGTKMLDQNGTGYIRLKQFSENSAIDLEKAMFTLHNQGMKNLVLDLRGNPGGLLDVCVVISDMFLAKGTIVSTRGRNASDNTQEVAKFAKTWAVPLVLLVDENSASASEILAAAIQENQRGIVVGRTTYKKGTVQTHFPMNSVSATLKLTTAKFYSPNGREMAGAGVTPDVPVNVQTTSYRGTSDDLDVQTAQNLISQGAPTQLMAGNWNAAQWNMSQNYGTPTYNTPNFNNNPAYNNAPNFNNVPYNAPNTAPNYGAPVNPGYNLTNTGNGNWNVNGQPNFNTNYGQPAPNMTFPSNYPGYNAVPRPMRNPGFAPNGYGVPQSIQAPAGMKDL